MQIVETLHSRMNKNGPTQICVRQPFKIWSNMVCLNQGVSYSQKFRSERGFPNLANIRNFPIYVSQILIEYRKVKILKSELKTEKSKKNKHKNNVAWKENKKKYIKIDLMCVTWHLNIGLLILCRRTCEYYAITL